MTRRFFGFGCSFTQGRWPTWVELLEENFDHSENWGQAGAGNFFIFNSIIECHIKNHITKDDTIGVMWTNVSREDRYRQGQWITKGNVFNSDWDKKWVRDWADIRGYYIRDLGCIYATKKILDSIGCTYHFMSMVDIDNPGDKTQVDRPNISDLLENYQEVLDIMNPSVHCVLFNYDWTSRPFRAARHEQQLRKNYAEVAGDDWPDFDTVKNRSFLNISSQKVIDEIMDLSRWNWLEDIKCAQRVDPHPIPGEHLIYLDAVLPRYPISQKMRQITEQYDYLLERGLPWQHLNSEFKTVKIGSDQRW